MRDRIVRVLAVVWTAVLVASAGGCAAAREPLGPASGPVTVVVCRSLSARDIAGAGGAAALKAVADRGAAALVARSPHGGATLRESLAGLPVALVDAGDAAAAPKAVVAAVRRVLDADPGATVVVLSDPDGAEGGLVVAAGPGIGRGLLASRSTHRAGLLAHEDVVTLVRSLASSETTRARAAVFVAPVDDAIEALAQREAYFEAARTAQPPLVIAFGVIACLAVLALWALALLPLASASRGYWTVVSLRALLFALSLPSATLLARVLDMYPQSPPRLLTLVLGVAGVLWIAAMALMERRGPSAAIAATCVATAAVLAADQLLGAPLSPGTALAYAPLAGFRFYGIGNEGAAVFVGSWLAASALAHGLLPGRSWKRVTLVSGAVVVAVSSLPVLGANSVVAAWGTVVVGVFVTEALRGRVRGRDIAAVGVAAVAAMAFVVAVERLTGAGTHVGAAAAQAEAGGGPLPVVLDRLSAVIRSYAAHPASLAGFLAWALLFVARFQAPRPFAGILDARRGVRAAATAALVGGAVASLTEDSSVVVMVLLVLYAAVALAGVSAQVVRKEA
ncbi:hypothetical protein MX659_05950 [Coriobacteriia bacterium Es71-Z0120]|uniref:hypothetical protein n=1 Tax=Parvivirga hydrogeniphila TaxID=2939460 RepID=UPI002260BE68|nr:hypothetical protein [Parvivirga hydrogeniphila]MCL4079127.1 hypothetical protein [Parvivirga hydrogeniphila]